MRRFASAIPNETRRLTFFMDAASPSKIRGNALSSELSSGEWLLTCRMFTQRGFVDWIA
jgi:hypothetical protein